MYYYTATYYYYFDFSLGTVCPKNTLGIWVSIAKYYVTLQYEKSH